MQHMGATGGYQIILSFHTSIPYTRSILRKLIGLLFDPNLIEWHLIEIALAPSHANAHARTYTAHKI